MTFTFPYLSKILLILLIEMTVYALIGCELYGRIDKGEILDDHINF
jgi:hypothetical protein